MTDSVSANFSNVISDNFSSFKSQPSSPVPASESHQYNAFCRADLDTMPDSAAKDELEKIVQDHEGKAWTAAEVDDYKAKHNAALCGPISLQAVHSKI